jgi:hypothetical protein
MKHLQEEEMVALYYGEGDASANAHMQTCRECFTRYAELKESLEMMKPARTPQRGADYAERVWQSIEPQLTPYAKKKSRWMSWRTATVAASCAAVLVGVFLAGGYWERASKPKQDVAKNQQGAQQRVVLVVLTDHLDRTERMLVQLEHADFSDRAENVELQSEARELLVSNRLYRTTANQAGDPALAGALDRLEGVLAEIANDPKLTTGDLERVRKEMNTGGILFEIRVLLARNPKQASGSQSAKGTSI